MAKKDRTMSESGTNGSVSPESEGAVSALPSESESTSQDTGGESEGEANKDSKLEVYAKDRYDNPYPKIPLDQIFTGKRARGYQQSKVNQLKLSIQSDGLIYPITVIKSPKGGSKLPYTLETGRHRLEAYKLLAVEKPDQYSQIPALESVAGDSKRTELAENLFRNGLSVLEQSEHILKYLAHSDEPVMKVLKDVKGKTKHSRTQLFRLKKIAENINEKQRQRIKNLKNHDLENSTRQLEFLAKKCTDADRDEILSALEGDKEGKLSVMDAHAIYILKVESESRRNDRQENEQKKIGSFKVSSSTYSQVEDLAKQHKMNPEEYLPKFLAEALQALHENKFELSVETPAEPAG